MNVSQEQYISMLGEPTQGRVEAIIYSPLRHLNYIPNIDEPIFQSVRYEVEAFNIGDKWYWRQKR